MDYSGCEHTENATRPHKFLFDRKCAKVLWGRRKVRLSDLKLHDIFEKASA